jgi:hypothetical protein
LIRAASWLREGNRGRSELGAATVEAADGMERPSPYFAWD